MSDYSYVKSLVVLLKKDERADLFQMLLGDKIKDDVLSILNLEGYDVPPEEEREDFARKVAEIYVFQGGSREDIPRYNETLSNLVSQAVRDYEHGER